MFLTGHHTTLFLTKNVLKGSIVFIEKPILRCCIKIKFFTV